MQLQNYRYVLAKICMKCLFKKVLTPPTHLRGLVSVISGTGTPALEQDIL